MMKFGVLFTLSFVITASAFAPLLRPTSESNIIEGEYIVVLKNEASSEDVSFHKNLVYSMLSDDSKIVHHYEIGSEFRGYAAKLSDEDLTKICSLPNIMYIERNQRITIAKERVEQEKTPQAQQACLTQQSAPWPLPRTQGLLYSSAGNPYYYEADDGEGVEVYISDTGIDVTHPEFGGRAFWGVDYVDGTYQDGNGHGTQVAGLVMSNTYGMAKAATAIAIRVFNNDGMGYTDDVISGIQFAVRRKESSDAKATILNMSHSAPGVSESLEGAVRAAVEMGVHIVVSAGNDEKNACDYTPSKLAEVVTVGATRKSDRIAGFSNYGECVDIFAPGHKLYTTDTNGNVVRTSGTSFAAPHVTGAMAKILGKDPSYTPTELKDYLISTAFVGQITGLEGEKANTPNLLLNGGSCH